MLANIETMGKCEQRDNTDAPRLFLVSYYLVQVSYQCVSQQRGYQIIICLFFLAWLKWAVI